LSWLASGLSLRHGHQPLPRHKVEQIRAELLRGTGIIKTARLCGTGLALCSGSKRWWTRRH